jgi:hypothetical protein
MEVEGNRWPRMISTRGAARASVWQMAHSDQPTGAAADLRARRCGRLIRIDPSLLDVDPRVVVQRAWSAGSMPPATAISWASGMPL